jgi:hypothetical protein
MNEPREIQLYENAPPPLSPLQVRQQINLIQEIMRDAMTDGEHYGKIPGCGSKPTLLKPGAEKLNLTFRMAPRYAITRREMMAAHVEYEVICSLYSIGSEKFLGEGVGSCSSMESKYRYRNVADFEPTDLPIPKDSKEKKSEYRKQGFGMKKVDNEWLWVKYLDAAKTENPDIADTYNTILKMAKKRALVDAVLTVTAASDIFTQDIEDQHDLPHTEPNSAASASSKPAGEAKKEKTGDDKGVKEPTLRERKEKAVVYLAEKGKAVADCENFLKRGYKDWTTEDLASLRLWAQRGFQDGPPETEPESDIPY